MILVVDDNREICRGIELLLRNNGFDAKCLTSGEAALEFIRLHPPNLVILDDMMPDKTGLDILATIRSSPEFPKVPILMMSAGSDENRRQEALRLGAVAWMSKTSDWSGVVQKVADLVH